MGTSPSQNHVLTAKEAGKSQEVKIGVLLAVELGGKPSTGYDWKYQGGGNDIVLSLGDPEFRILGPAENVEQDARYTFRFRAARIGVSTLIFRYARPWEKDGDSERLSFPIRVVQ